MKKVRKKNRKEWATIVAAIVAAVLFLCIFLMLETKALAAYDVTSVVTARTEIEEGTQITSENVESLFTVTQMQTEYVIENAVTDPKALVGYVVDNGIHQKEMVSPLDITDRQGWIESMTEPIEFTFCASSVADAVAGSVRGGDMIDVGITYQKEDGQAYFESVGRSIYVKEVYNESGTVIPRTDKDTVCTMFRVVMEKIEGEALLERLRAGDEVIVTLPQ